MHDKQNKDADECISMEENGKSKDCCGCSCNVCLFQTDYVSIKEVIELIDREIVRNQKEHPQETLGMMHIKSKLCYVG